MIISKFVLKKYWNLNILILKFALKKLHIRNLCLSYEYEFRVINIYIKIYYIYICVNVIEI